MYEANQFNDRLQFLNNYFEHGQQEHREREGLLKVYREWGAEEEGPANTERGDRSED